MRPRACVSVTVAQEDAEPVRRALFCALYRHIKRLVVVQPMEPETPETRVTLQIVLDRGVIEEALEVVLATARCARLAQVRSC